MRLGIFAKTFTGHDPLTVLTAAKNAGFSTVQYNFACSGIASLPEAIDTDIVTEIQSPLASLVSISLRCQQLTI